MTRMMGSAALMAAILTIAPLQADAQMGRRGQREMRPQQGRPGVEMIMRMREQLELSDGQLSQLEDLREAVVEHRTARAAEMEALRSERMATPRDPEALRAEADELRARAEARRAEEQAFSESIREQVESILNDDQREQLQQLSARAQAYERGRQAGMRGQRGSVRQGRGAARGGRGSTPGMRRGGRGWGPAQGGTPAQGRGFRRGGDEGLGFGPPWMDLEGDEAPPTPPGS